MSRFSELYRRIISALIGAAVIISALIYGEWGYFVVFFTIALLAQWEFYRLVRMQSYIPVRYFGVAIGGILFVLSFLIERGTLPSNYYFLLFPLASLIFLIKLYKKKDENPFVNIAFFYLGICYVALPFTLINVIVFSHNGNYSYQILFGLMLIIWASDTGAYFAGTAFGKTKLFERISPKKSWEGSVGGAATSVAFAIVLSRFYTDLNMLEWLIVAGIVVVAGTYGDLVESLFKRSMSIKDSGNVIPGHGGFLDRFDSLILAVPFVVVFLKLI
ncbi:MAG: phosphatidate cytidylyltransferase [Cyclobacteriaceae bacterium]